MYLLDTNICIYLIKRYPPQVMSRFESLLVGDVVISSITLAELEHGVEKEASLVSSRRKALNNLIDALPVLDFGRSAARAYGKIRARGEHLGRHRFDTLIAAHALSVHAVLVSNNTADFKGIYGLKLENWAA